MGDTVPSKARFFFDLMLLPAIALLGTFLLLGLYSSFERSSSNRTATLDATDAAMSAAGGPDLWTPAGKASTALSAEGWMRAPAYSSRLPGTALANGSVMEVFVLPARSGANASIARVALCPVPGATPSGCAEYRAPGRT